MSMYRVLIADDEMIERKVLYKTLTENLGDQCTICLLYTSDAADE